MERLARFVIAKRWWVVAGWVAFVILTNVISQGLGGASYKDELKLPHTETQTVSDLLANSGQSNQNGIDGIMVVRSKSGSMATPPAGLVAGLERQCATGSKVVAIGSPWGSIHCGT